MKHNNKLPFKLNMPYEELEFDLEPIQDRIQGYDSYLYIGQISIFDTVPKKVELIFYWERLKIIILEFEPVDLPKVKKLSKLNFKKVNNFYIKATFKTTIQVKKDLLRIHFYNLIIFFLQRGLTINIFFM